MVLGLFFRQLPAMEKILYRAINFLAIGCPRLLGREQPQAKSSKTKKLVTADSIGTRSGLCSRCPRAEAGLAVRHRTTHSDDCKNRTCPTVACLLHPYKAGTISLVALATGRGFEPDRCLNSRWLYSESLR